MGLILFKFDYLLNLNIIIMNSDIIEKLSKINNSKGLIQRNIIVRRLLKEIKNLDYPILEMCFKNDYLNFSFDLFSLGIPFYDKISNPILIIKLLEGYPFKIPNIKIDPNINYYYYLNKLNILPEIHCNVISFIGDSQIDFKKYLFKYQKYKYEAISSWNQFIDNWSPSKKIDDILNKIYLIVNLY